MSKKTLLPFALLTLAACQNDSVNDSGFASEDESKSSTYVSPAFEGGGPRELCGINPGPAEVTMRASTVKMSNRVLDMVFTYAEEKLVQIHHQDLLNGVAFRGVRDPFLIGLGKEGYVPSSKFRVIGEPQIEKIVPKGGIRAADGLGGVKVSVNLVNEEKGIDAVWTAVLLDNTPYIRYELKIVPTKTLLNIDRVELLAFVAPYALPGGTTEGAPVVNKTFFAGLEHPMSVNRIQADWKSAPGVSLKEIKKGTLNPVTFPLAENLTEAGDIQVRICLTTPEEVLYLENVRLCREDEVIAHFPGRRALKGLDAAAVQRQDVVNRNEAFYEFTLPQSAGDYVIKADAELFTFSRDPNTKISYELKTMVNRPQKYQRVTCINPNPVILGVGKSYQNSAVFGVAQEGQLRRTFNYYTELERAHPYRQFLHYNTWYDIGYFSKFKESEALDVINDYCSELGIKRGIMPESFLLDDGWDDSKSLWNFHKGFPNGFTPLAETTRKLGSSIGVWLSPWGGYGQPKEDRLAAAKPFGYETNDQGFSLSGRKYYARFKEICSEMITKYNVGMFKFDGLGRTGRCDQSDFNTDFEASIALIEHLRSLRPDLLVNLTTGTWPSPFWLKITDTIWRTGTDHDFFGVGPDRQRWITYRDQDTYESIVQGCELFPINSLMLHGVIYAKHAYWLDYDNDHGEGFTSEVRSFFGTGTMLQELYVSPALMDAKHWDIVADAAKWARKNQDIMTDMHWIGGCPIKLEVYGWAAWLPNKGVMTLRNPNQIRQTFMIDPVRDFQLPPNASRNLIFKSPFKDQRIQILASNGEEIKVVLEPFEVLVFDVE